ncbi:MAG: 3-dehydroquinate synthase [Bacteroidia bacterium]|nr:3-dehydroquinate synthase [Bacteroidia bacterium]
MDNLSLNLVTGTTEILFGNYSEKLNLATKNRRIIIICDQNVNKLYPYISQNYPVINFLSLESEKTLVKVEQIYNKLIELKADRSTLIVAIGGGIVCDITGFIASTFYRGLPFILIPTSLLAMVDASIGGKNGVNFNNHKNIIGTIRQPESIIIDTTFLSTLPREEFKNGISEIIKHSIISGEQFYNSLLNNTELRSGVVNYNIIKSAIQTKTEIVSLDPFENGIRRILNFGHTIGHIIELKEGISHGKAIAIGMMMTTKLSVYFNYCNNSIVENLFNLLSFYELPVKTTLNIKDIIEFMEFDKKKTNDSLHFVFVSDIGKLTYNKISIENLKKGLLSVFD